MMLTKLHITLLICFFIPFIQSYTYRVDLYADSQLNNMSLTKGVYKNITIEIHPNDLTTPLVSGKTTLSISDQRFKLSDGEIVVDTNKRRTYHTYLGISCNAEVTEEEIVNIMIENERMRQKIHEKKKEKNAEKERYYIDALGIW